ncbi:Hypothetical predicted protein, partial [Podarcis lilfordi]
LENIQTTGGIHRHAMKNVLLVQGFRLARQNDSLSPLPERCLRGSPDMPLKDQKRHEEGGEEVGFTQ